MDWDGCEACVLCEDCNGNQIVLIRRQRFCMANGEWVKCRRFS
jgi:hypothetical protein